MAEKIILGICTSGSRLKLAAQRGSAVFKVQKKVYNQERVLFGLARGLLARAGAELRTVNVVCAARGPGRFTGIRISLTLASALKALSRAEVYTATLFEILALQAFESAHFRAAAEAWELKRIAVLLHAFKDEYFCQFFKAGKKLKMPRPEAAPVWLKAGELKDLLAASGAFYAIGDSEEDPAVYGLAPAAQVRAPAAISKILPGYIIKAALAYGSRTLRPLYLKPAKYELLFPKAVPR